MRRWYHYNEGGIDEMQFNFAMSPDYYRIGIGFSFSTFENADVVKTAMHLRAFQDVVKSDRREFERLVRDLNLRNLRVESLNESSPVRITDHLINWPGGEWLFVGRLLYIEDPRDAAVLADDVRLLKVFDEIFGAFVPYWCRVMSHVHRRNLRALAECRMCSARPEPTVDGASLRE